jgi:hypothetical protein
LDDVFAGGRFEDQPKQKRTYGKKNKNRQLHSNFQSYDRSTWDNADEDYMPSSQRKRKKKNQHGADNPLEIEDSSDEEEEVQHMEQEKQVRRMKNCL